MVYHKYTGFLQGGIRFHAKAQKSKQKAQSFSCAFAFFA